MPDSTMEAKPQSAVKEGTWQDSMVSKFLWFLLSLGIFLVLWQLLAMSVNNRTTLSAPIPVLQAVLGLLSNKVPPGNPGLATPYSAILETFAMIAAGFMFALVGIPIGVVMGRWKSAEAIIDPWVNGLYSIPMVALIPVLYFLIGGNFWSDVFVTWLVAVFVIIINTYQGVKYTSNSLAEVGKTFGANESQFLLKVVLPASLPDIVAGMRLGLGRAVLGAVVAEVLLSVSSLGNMLMDFQSVLQTPYMMAIIFFIALLGIATLQTPKLLEHRLFKWKETERLSRSI
jgi:ABC-type nitrate/sulfonate/bicarbonate transport system permease component